MRVFFSVFWGWVNIHYRFISNEKEVQNYKEDWNPRDILKLLKTFYYTSQFFSPQNEATFPLIRRDYYKKTIQGGLYINRGITLWPSSRI